MKIGIVTDGVRGAEAEFVRQIDRLDRTNQYVKIIKHQAKPVSFRAWLKDLLVERPVTNFNLIHQTSPTLGIKFSGPIIVSAQDFEADTLTAPIYKQIVSWSYRAASLVLVNSQFQKDNLIKLYGLEEERLWLVDPAIGTSFKPVRNTDQLQATRIKYKLGERYIVASGSPRRALRFFKLLKEKFRSPLKLALMGGSKIDEPDVVVINPHTTDLPAIYSAACFAIASPDTSCSRVLEMMRVGLPVLTTVEGCLAEHGGMGVIAAIFKDWPEVGLSLLVDQGLRQQVSLRAQKQARKATWQRAISQTVKAYESVVARSFWQARALNSV